MLQRLQLHWTIVLVAGATAAFAQAQSFEKLGQFSGGDSSQGEAVSGNGSTAVGFARRADGNYRGFTWNSPGPILSLEPLPGWPSSQALGVNGNGSVIVGDSFNETSGSALACRWTGQSNPTPIGPMPGGTFSYAFGVSADGTSIVGYGDNSTSSRHAFRWTESGGFVDLGSLPEGPYSYAYAISADGAVTVGNSGALGSLQACRWVLDTPHSLGVLAGETNSVALSVSLDGTTIVGTSYSPSGDRAFRWTSALGKIRLGALPGATTSYGNGVSGDGLTVVGACGYPSGNRAFLWNVNRGMVDLNTYLPGLGIDLNGWDLTEARGVSADGSIIVGTGTHNGVQEAWVANVPVRCPADFDGSGFVDFEDFIAFVHAFEAGC